MDASATRIRLDLSTHLSLSLPQSSLLIIYFLQPPRLCSEKHHPDILHHSPAEGYGWDDAKAVPAIMEPLVLRLCTVTLAYESNLENQCRRLPDLI